MRKFKLLAFVCAAVLCIACCFAATGCTEDSGPKNTVQATVDAVNAGNLDGVLENCDSTTQTAVNVIVSASSTAVGAAENSGNPQLEAAAFVANAASFALGFAADNIQIPEDVASAKVTATDMQQRIEDDTAYVNCHLKLDITAASNPASFELDHEFKLVKDDEGAWKLTFVPDAPNITLPDIQLPF